MKRLSLLRTDLLRLWLPGVAESDLEAVERIGDALFETLQDGAPPHRDRPGDREAQLLLCVARELGFLAGWLDREMPDLSPILAGADENAWREGYFADYGIRLQRFLQATAARVEEGLAPDRDTLAAWRAGLPDRVPEWNRVPLRLEFPSALRRPARSAAGFAIQEARGDVAVLGEFFDLAAERLRRIARRVGDEATRRPDERAAALARTIGRLADATAELARSAGAAIGGTGRDHGGDAAETATAGDDKEP